MDIDQEYISIAHISCRDNVGITTILSANLRSIICDPSLSFRIFITRIISLVKFITGIPRGLASHSKAHKNDIAVSFSLYYKKLGRKFACCFLKTKNFLYDILFLQTILRLRFTRNTIYKRRSHIFFTKFHILFFYSHYLKGHTTNLIKINHSLNFIYTK